MKFLFFCLSSILLQASFINYNDLNEISLYSFSSYCSNNELLNWGCGYCRNTKERVKLIEFFEKKMNYVVNNQTEEAITFGYVVIK
jgi:hypothetical protein